jgi:hypothetical protein
MSLRLLHGWNVLGALMLLLSNLVVFAFEYRILNLGLAKIQSQVVVSSVNIDCGKTY